MSKNFSGDWKGEGAAVGDGETQVIPRMITSQASAAAPGLPLPRPALSLQTPGQPAYILQPHHEMKNYGVSSIEIPFNEKLTSVAYWLIGSFFSVKELFCFNSEFATLSCRCWSTKMKEAGMIGSLQILFIVHH